MHPELDSFTVSIVRGGTSKGIFILESELPKQQPTRDNIILSIFGSPDIRQIDGLGGADSLTSKLAIIGPSTRADADVDYTFGQVSLTKAFIDYKGNCGNISSAVGAFAIENGLVSAIEPITKVRVHMVNTGRILLLSVPVIGNKARIEGDYKISGVPGSGAKVGIDWADCGGESTGKLLPSGNLIDQIEVDSVSYPVSVVDAGNITVFIAATSLGLSGIESPSEIEADKGLMTLIESIRGKVAQQLGLIDDWQLSAQEIPYAPFFSIVSPSASYTTRDGKSVAQDEINIVSRLLFMQGVHKTHPVTGTVALGACCRIPGTIAHQALSGAAAETDLIWIGHPSGRIEIESAVACSGNEYHLAKSIVARTARIILKGEVYVRKSIVTAQ
ncbi:2-methylaconitate cis-trans isomerase PrpF family protein [Testudinibacter sp. TR-2022]|uniref:2-methylaconitate cis-trans isomerase PrpF family protein n=1 Tax=Testudinibacter sp. TR-2022 TaxID=2585029 RepID=UPI001119C9DC|nr:PrpF domain-containing protein [Testudinibacter sp. TR-2022]TNH07244.1 3-methylitaconate isomerase [Pasteurellaceae bacterium Phil11]TNH21114.1 3-methylitaconate isomerase [Testudinibacter sp. TR-2022]TNH27791.1 3-methylitaconate isomerase [Testudinibacter sp. TR-2022]